MTAVEFLINRISIFIPEDIGSQLMFKSNVDKAKQKEKKNAIDFYNWMKKEECESNWEQYFHYTDEDMYNEYLKQKHNES